MAGRLTLALPLILLFVLALVEIARSAVVSWELTNAAEDGTEVGMLPHATTSDIHVAVRAALRSQGITAATTAVKVNGAVADAATAQAGDEITVLVTVPIREVTWLPGGQYLQGNLSGQHTLRRK